MLINISDIFIIFFSIPVERAIYVSKSYGVSIMYYCIIAVIVTVTALTIKKKLKLCLHIEGIPDKVKKIK